MFNRDILKFFNAWYYKKRRKPLVIRGARQVGKTVAVTLFGEKYFKNIITLNLEKEENLSMFQRMMPISDLIQLIQLKTGKKIIPGSTLLFIDEIQNSQIAMTQMRYFIAEQFVGQALQTLSHGRMYHFSYWFRGKKSSLAEIDFLVQKESKLLPVEVKSGKAGHLKSVHLFMSESSSPAAVKIHSGNIYIQEIERSDGSTFKLISLPFYLVYRLEDVVI